MIGGFGVNSLPAKGAARGLSAMALAICALSVFVHLIALLGFHSRAILNFQIGLAFGIFLLAIPAILAEHLLFSEFPSSMFDSRFNGSGKLKIILADNPGWLRRSYYALLYYLFAFFLVFAYRTFPNPSTQLDEILWFSAVTAVFYCYFAIIFTSYAVAERPYKPTL